MVEGERRVEMTRRSFFRGVAALGAVSLIAPDTHVSESPKKELLTDPMARFNLDLDGNNPLICPDIYTGPDPLGVLKDREVTRELARELKTPFFLEDPQTGQKINTLHLNRSEAGRVLVTLPSYNNAIATGTTNYRLEELARQTRKPMYAFDHPGMGDSEDLTVRQKKALKRGDYGEVAGAYLRILKKQGVEEIDLVAQSMGAWAAVHVATKAQSAGIRVGKLMLIETPGLVDTSAVDLGRRFIEENKYLKLYQTNPKDDEKMVRAAGLNQSALKQTAQLVGWVISSLRNDPGFVYAKAMSRGGVSGLLEEAFGANELLEVIDVHGTISGVSPHTANSRVFSELKTKYGRRVRRLIFSGEPHTVMEGAIRYAALTRLLLEAS